MEGQEAVQGAALTAGSKRLHTLDEQVDVMIVIYGWPCSSKVDHDPCPGMHPTSSHQL